MRPKFNNPLIFNGIIFWHEICSRKCEQPKRKVTIVTGRIFRGVVGAIAGGLGLLALSGSGWAVPFVSGDGTETCAYVSPLAGSGACAVEIISSHPAWMPDSGLNAKWISYGPTGYQDAGPVAPRDPVLPLFRVTETFILTEENALSVFVWADDTAEVFINGVSMFPPNFTQNVCANGSIGCEPNEVGTVTATLAAGTHTLSFDVWQIGTGLNTSNNPFGLLYFGSLDPTGGGGGTNIDEAGALGILGLGLVALGVAQRRRRIA